MCEKFCGVVCVPVSLLILFFDACSSVEVASRVGSPAKEKGGVYVVFVFFVRKSLVAVRLGIR